MGMPGWAMALGAPLAADKLIVDPISSVYGLYKGIRDDQNDQNDKLAGMQALEQFRQNPNSEFDVSKFSNPKAAAEIYDTAMKMKDTAYVKQADPVLAQFQTDYQSIAGTTNPRFFADEENRAEMVKAGLSVPSGKDNPYIAKGLQDFAQKGQKADTLANAFAQGQSGGRIDPDLLSSLALDEKLPGQFDNTAQGANRMMDQVAKGSATAREAQGRQDISSFYRDTTGLAGPSQSPSGIARFARTAGYDPNGADDIRAAGAAYNVPAEVVNKEVDNYRQQMEKTPVGKPYLKNLQTGNATRQEMLQDFVLGGSKSVGSGVNNHPKAAPTVAPGAPNPATQMFWTQSDPNGPPILEEVPIGSPAYKRYMGGDLAQTGRVKPFGKKGQMTSGQAQASFKYSPQEKVSTTNDAGEKVTATRAKGMQAEAPAKGPDLATAQKLVTKYGSAEAARAAYAKGER